MRGTKDVAAPTSIGEAPADPEIGAMTTPAVAELDETSLVRTPTSWRRQLGRWLAVGDAVVISLASLGAYLVRDALGATDAFRPFANEVPVAIAVIPLWLLALHLAGAYHPEYLNAGGDAFRRFTAGVVAGVLGLGFVSFLLNLQLSRLFVALLAVLVFLGGAGMRAGVRRYVRRRQRAGHLVQRALIIGTDDDARQLARTLTTAQDSSYQVVGFLDDAADAGTSVGGLPVLGGTCDVLGAARQHGVGVVIVSPSGVAPGTLRDVTIDLEGANVDLAVAPSLFQVVTRRMTIETVDNMPLLHVDQIRLTRAKATGKRFLDVTTSMLLLVVALPVMAVVALAIRWDGPGPVLFRQDRVGRDGRAFTMLKFRTMVLDAEKRREDLEHANEADGNLFKLTSDPRVTRVGRPLRRWSLDELPQLLNVLRGDMSMVGPRPPLPDEVARYDPWHHRRLRVRPGLTGVWQVSGRSTVGFDEAVRMDLFYIENWSPGFDLQILCRTVGAVLSRRGAW